MSFKTMKFSLMLTVGVLLGTLASPGAVLIEWQGNNNGDANDFTGWASEQYGNDNAAYFDISGQNNNTTLSFNPDTSGDGIVHSDVHYTTASAFTGNLVDKYGVAGDNPYLQMNFYYDSSAGPQQGLGFYFAGTSGREWYYNIDSSYVNDGWNTFRVQLDYNADPYPSGGSLWYRENGGETLADFNTDIEDVSRVGMWVAYHPNTSTAGQGQSLGLYGISVPEPQTYLLLGMALLSVAIVFRKRISESLVEARAMLRN